MEWLTDALDLRPGIRVLDLGCGRACSSIFLRREFGVQVWAVDLWFSASANFQRIRDAEVDEANRWLTLHFNDEKTAGMHLSMKPVSRKSRSLLAKAVLGRVGV